MHQLTKIDLDARTADCQECGPTRIYVSTRRGRVSPQCVVSAGRKTPELDPTRHRLTNVTGQPLRGDCSVCGPDVRVLEGWNKAAGTWIRKCWAKTRLAQAGYEAAKRGWSQIDATAPELAKLERDQGNHCAICPRSDALHLDHCHATGRVRGFLCQPHNMGIGLLDDNPAILRAAAAYLET